jgi:hypothetical protein
MIRYLTSSVIRKFAKYLPVLIFTFFILEVNGQKTDKVFLLNGDILTGEIKNLKLAKLKYDMDGPGIIEIKWEMVKSIRSERQFEIVLQSGEVLVSKLDSIFFSSHSIAVDNIVEIYPMRKKILKRISGNVNAGFNYNKSSEILEFNFSGGIVYRIPKLELSLTTNSFITNTSDTGSLTKEQDVKYTTIVYFGKKYLAGGGLEWQQNTELGIANRFSLNGFIGKVLILDNHNRMTASSGLSLNKEQSVTSTDYSTNVELPIILVYKRFFYNTPRQSIDTHFSTFPSFTEWGRIRLEFSLNTSIEIFKDFLVGVTFYDKFDNRPPEGAASKNDFAVAFTLGYKFNY